jgi:hypothetical protein
MKGSGVKAIYVRHSIGEGSGGRFGRSSMSCNEDGDCANSRVAAAATGRMLLQKKPIPPKLQVREGIYSA